MIEITPNLHPVFVHFTVALYSMSVIFYAAHYFIKADKIRSEIIIVANWCLWTGAVFTVGTVATGWNAYNTVIHDDPSHLAMTDHRNWALVTAFLFLSVAVKQFIASRQDKFRSTGITVALIAGFILLSVTAWKGGELVYRYGLGVISMPVVSSDGGDGHDHVHGESITITAQPKLMEKPEVLSTDVEKINPQKNGAHEHAHGDSGHVHN